MNSSTMSKRGMMLGLLAAVAIAFALAMSMTATAHAANAKPYAGYQDVEEYYSVYDAEHKWVDSVQYTATLGAGNITMTNVGDTRNVAAGLLNDSNSFTVWSGNSYKGHLTEFNGGDTYDDNGNYTADYCTIVDNTSQFKKLKGMSYNKKKNTLTLKNVKAPAYTLNITGMGTGFKIVLKGTNQLAGINIYATEKATQLMATDNGYASYITSEIGQYPCKVTIQGKGKLIVNKKKYNSSPVSINGGGSYDTYNRDTVEHSWDGTTNYAYTASGLTIAKTAKVQLFAYGTANIVNASNCASKKPFVVKSAAKNLIADVAQKVAKKTSYDYDWIDVFENPTTSTSYYYLVDGTKYSYSDDKYCMVLNDGAFYGEPDYDSGFFYDTTLREKCYAKWNIYKKATSVTRHSSNGYYDDDDNWVSGETDTVLTGDYYIPAGTVDASKDTPKGYTPKVESTDGAHYSYVAKNSSLTVGKF